MKLLRGLLEEHSVKITQRTADRLILTGVPAGRAGVLGATLIGGVILAGIGAFGVALYREQGWGVPHIAMGFGMLLAGAIFVGGLVTLLVARERLTLDRTTRTVTYESRSPIVETERPFEAPLESIDSVVLSDRSEWRRSGDDDNSRKRVEVWTASLRVRKPRRSVVLDVTENNREARVRALAEQVAAFLGLEVSEESDAAATADVSAGATLAGRGQTSGDAPPAPEGAEWIERAARDGRRVFETSKPSAAGGVGCLLIVASFIGLIACTFIYAAWLPEMTVNGEPIQDWQRWTMSAPGAFAAVAIPYCWFAFLRGRHRITIDERKLRYAFVLPGTRPLEGLPGAGVLARGLGHSIPTNQINSIKSVTRQETRVVEVRSGSQRFVIPSRLDEADAKASSDWLALTLRHEVRSRGAE